MKTAVSIPDDLFRRAEDLARRLGKSRSQVYREALAEYVFRREPRSVTQALDEVADELEEIQAIRLGLETFLSRHGAERVTDDALAEMARRRKEMERAYRRADLDDYIASFWSLRDACYRCAERPKLLRALADQRLRVERYVRYLCRDPEAFALLRRGPDTLVEACKARDGEAAEAATRDALMFVLHEFQQMLEADAAA